MQPVNEFKSKSGLKRIVSAFFYSLDGLKAAWRQEHAFRQELGLFVVGTVIALLLRISAFEKLVLIGVLLLVLIVLRPPYAKNVYQTVKRFVLFTAVAP